MKLANILTLMWMRGRKTEELAVMVPKITNALDDVLDDIHDLSIRASLSSDEKEDLADLRDERAHLGQVIEDLERVLEERVARPLAA